MKKFQISAGIITAVCVILIIVFGLVQTGLSRKLDCQQVVSRWAADGTRYAQLTAVISPYAGFDESMAAGSVPSSIDSALTGASISSSSENEGARLYAYAYSAETDVTLSREDPENGKAVKSGIRATATGVGKDFFVFHRLKMLSGQYFNTDDKIYTEQCIIDNNLAWQLFGSYDVAGREIEVNGVTFNISGVCEVDPDYKQFYGENGRMFLIYSTLKSVTVGSDGDLPITCFEICMPDPVTNFAKDAVAKAVSVDETEYELIENSARFTDRGLLANLKTSAERSVRQKLVVYPYWENTATILADKAAGLYVFKFVPIVIICLLAVTEVVLFYINRKKIFTAAVDAVKRWWKDYRYSHPKKTKKLKKGEETGVAKV